MKLCLQHYSYTFSLCPIFRIVIVPDFLSIVNVVLVFSCALSVGVFLGFHFFGVEVGFVCWRLLFWRFLDRFVDC